MTTDAGGAAPLLTMCTACGAELQAGALFCARCGAKLPTVEEPGAELQSVGVLPPQRRRVPVIAIVGASLVVLIAVALVVVATHGAARYKIHGALMLRDSDEVFAADQPCAGSGGYSDIRDGAQVTVTDETGKLLGVGSLNEGVGVSGSCLLTFDTIEVPKAKFYSVEVSHRGKITDSFAEAKSQEFSFLVTLGP